MPGTSGVPLKSRAMSCRDCALFSGLLVSAFRIAMRSAGMISLSTILSQTCAAMFSTKTMCPQPGFLPMCVLTASNFGLLGCAMSPAVSQVQSGTLTSRFSFVSGFVLISVWRSSSAGWIATSESDARMPSMAPGSAPPGFSRASSSLCL